MDDYLSKPIRLNSLAMQLEKYGLAQRARPSGSALKDLWCQKFSCNFPLPA